MVLWSLLKLFRYNSSQLWMATWVELRTNTAWSKKCNNNQKNKRRMLRMQMNKMNKKNKIKSNNNNSIMKTTLKCKWPRMSWCSLDQSKMTIHNSLIKLLSIRQAVAYLEARANRRVGSSVIRARLNWIWIRWPRHPMTMSKWSRNESRVEKGETAARSIRVDTWAMLGRGLREIETLRSSKAI